MKSIYTYLKVGYLLHLVTVAEIVLLYIAYRSFYIQYWLQHDAWLLKHCIAFVFICMPFFPQLDARSRYQDYKQLRDLFYTYGFKPRVVKPFIKSRCQRDAVLAAAADFNVTAACKKHFYKLGYRWYHYFPDFVFTDPQLLYSKQFWQTTFFAKTYHPKIHRTDIKKHCITKLSLA
jgi:hypothetical protein